MLDQALTVLHEETAASDPSRAEIADAAAAVGRLVNAIDFLIQQDEARQQSFADFLAEHRELTQ